jgi:hypothetical protein
MIGHREKGSKVGTGGQARARIYGLEYLKTLLSIALYPLLFSVSAGSQTLDERDQ